MYALDIQGAIVLVVLIKHPDVPAIDQDPSV